MKKTIWLALALCILFAAIAGYKILVLHVGPETVIPARAYWINYRLSVIGHGDPITIRAKIPPSDSRQTITGETSESPQWVFALHDDRENRTAEWNIEGLNGPSMFSYSFLAWTKETDYAIPAFLSRPALPDTSFAEYLHASKLIQKDSAIIRQTAAGLGLDSLKNLVELVRRVYAFAADSIQTTRFSGETDAVTACLLREASCNGKSRLAVALLRNQGIPARLVGGLILESGAKRTSHQWVEALMGTEWVPFCPLNHHLFKIPGRYLAVYRGDESFFSRTSNVRFRYSFEISKRLIERPQEEGSRHLLSLIDVWGRFQKANVSLELLKIVLMLPIGALVTVIFRNVVGLHTFGTFLPALIATAYGDTGVWWGHLSFLAILGVGIFVRHLLRNVELLHTPKLGIILVFVVLTMLTLAVVGIERNLPSLARVALFPMVIMSITIERFYLVAEEDGLRKALVMLASSLVVVTFCYWGMLSLLLQTTVLAFPETMLLVIAANLYLGSWTGLRLSEFYRFRRLVFASPGSGHGDR